MTPCAAPSRRNMILAAAANVALAGGCSRSQRRSGWLNYLLGMEPLSLDPAKCAGGSEVSIMAAIYEPLIRLHPETMAPMAGLATNYKIERGGTRYTFYLRGHQSPEGIRLPGVESVPVEFNRGRAGGRRDLPARWSDGAPITASDLVASWRHYLAPETGAVLRSGSCGIQRRQSSGGAARRACAGRIHLPDGSSHSGALFPDALRLLSDASPATARHGSGEGARPRRIVG